ncbi:5'-nucleotidase C-terminal domain-containing protein [Solibacillus sp. FSL H8-0538]|uniref:5'-nucleotidase C-terminal domain-containing protein n=1 Tax=Solibacillus sp. FSL H8-0538 TaxID=2921400 RepID=UPI0030FB9C5E
MNRKTYIKFVKAGLTTALVTSAVVAVAPNTSEANGKKESEKEHGKDQDKDYGKGHGKDHDKDHGKGHDKDHDKDHEKPTPIVDKAKLQTAINNVVSLKKEDYTIDSWNKLQQALSEAQKVVKDKKASSKDVAKALNDLIAATDKLVVKIDPTVATVNTFKELKAAINNPKVKTISINNGMEITEKLKVSSEKHIYGNGYTLTSDFSGKGDNSYVLQFDKTSGSITNIKLTGADTAIEISGSSVTLSGTIDVSGNKLGGIIVSKDSGAKSKSKLDITNATLLNKDEANNKPTILEEQIESTDAPNRVVGYEGMYVDYNQKAANNLQRFYFINHELRPPNPLKSFTLSLMHSNDTHANLNQIAKKATAVKEVRAAKPNALLVDAGDVFSGTLYFNEFKGQADLQFMNVMGYDIMTFGNHEFDLGSSAEGHKALADFVKGAQFSFVSSNVNFSNDANLQGLFSDLISSNPKNGKIYNGIVKEIDGEKVGFFGLTTAETRDISNPGAITFENYIEEANKAVKAFEGMGVNKIVAITHIGYDDNPAFDNDLNLAAMVEGIDVIVGGHSHTQLATPVIVDADGTPTIIVQAYQYNDYLGTLDVEFNKKGVVVKHEGQLIKIADKVDDLEASTLLGPYKAKVEELAAQEIGATAVSLLENPRTNGDNTKPSVRKNETPLGNVITDGMLQKAKTYNQNVIMAFQNGGGIRAGINEGSITIGEVITVLPFGNTLATMNLTGAEIKETFEHSLKDLPRENGGFLHVSGAKVEYDSSKPAGERIVSIKYKNADNTYTEVLDNATYTIATNAFTAKGGDGFTVLAKAYSEGRVTDLGLSDWENFRDHLVSLGSVDPKVEGRIVDVIGKGTELPGGNISERDFSGTMEAPKVYKGDVTVNITDVALLRHAVVKGNLIIRGTRSGAFSLADILVEGNLDLSGLDASDFDLGNIEVYGDTNF